MYWNNTQRFKAQKNQLDPHFLFNTFNTLDSLIQDEPVRARNYLQQLSSVFRYVIDDSLEKISQQLAPNDFFRINRQYIVSRQAIQDASIWFSGRLALNLSVPAPERLFVSRSNLNEFKQWLSR